MMTIQLFFSDTVVNQEHWNDDMYDLNESGTETIGPSYINFRSLAPKLARPSDKRSTKEWIIDPCFYNDDSSGTFGKIIKKETNGTIVYNHWKVHNRADNLLKACEGCGKSCYYTTNNNDNIIRSQ